MPYNTRQSFGVSSQSKVELYHLVSFPIDETCGYFKVNACRASKEDPNIVKISYRGKIYEAVVLFTGSKSRVKEEALLKKFEVSCSSDDEGAHDILDTTESMNTQGIAVVNKQLNSQPSSQLNTQITTNDFFSPPTQRRLISSDTASP
jgi:hypothetical protein